MEHIRGGAGKTALQSRLHLITLPLLFPLSPVNVYFIGGDIPTLIDTGMDTDIAWEGLVGGLKGLGYSLGDIERIVLTHGHIDHFGLVGRICDYGSPEILIHSADELRASSGIDVLVGQIQENSRRFVSMGISERDVDRLFRNYINILRRFYTPIRGYNTILDGDMLDFGDFCLEVVHTPGHTEGSICLFEVADDVGGEGGGGLLFSGDHVMEGISTGPLPEMTPVPRVGVTPYLESMRRVLGLDVGAVLPGHGGMIHDPKNHIDLLFRYYEDMTGKLKGVIESMGDICLTPMEISMRMFPGITGIQYLNVVFAVYNCLTSLEEEGRVLSEERDGYICFGGA